MNDTKGRVLWIDFAKGIGALIDHHCEIGAFSHIMMGAVVRGNAKIAEQSWARANEVIEDEPEPMPGR